MQLQEVSRSKLPGERPNAPFLDPCVKVREDRKRAPRSSQELQRPSGEKKHLWLISIR